MVARLPASERKRHSRLSLIGNEAHLSAAKAAIQYSETVLQSLSLTMKAKMRKMSYHAFRTLQRPPSSQKIFWSTSSLSNYPLGISNEEQPNLRFCPCSNSSQPWREKMTSFLMMIMDARQLPWPLKKYWDIWKMKVTLLIQPFPSIFKHWILSVKVMLDRILV